MRFHLIHDTDHDGPHRCVGRREYLARPVPFVQHQHPHRRLHDVALRFRELSPRVYERLCAAVSEVLAPPRNPAGFERRRWLRRWFGRRAIARWAGSPRGLLGRDLSAGGMRVENAAGLSAGEELELALHSQVGDVPLVLRASVLRSGASGEAVLEYSLLSGSQRLALEKLLAQLGGGDGPSVVSEELEPALQPSVD